MGYKDLEKIIEKEKINYESRGKDLDNKIKSLNEELSTYDQRVLYNKLANAKNDKEERELNEKLDRIETIKSTLKRLENVKKFNTRLNLSEKDILNAYSTVNNKEILELKKRLKAELEQLKTTSKELTDKISEFVNEKYSLKHLLESNGEETENIKKEVVRLDVEKVEIKFNAPEIREHHYLDNFLQNINGFVR